MIDGLVAVGYWRSNGDDLSKLPDPRTHVHADWLGSERDAVARYLRQGKVHARWRGNSRCRICGITNGSLDLSDGIFVWPQGFAHYVEEHHVRPPQALIDHILSNLGPGATPMPMHVFLIEDSERHWVVAEDEEDAMKVLIQTMGEPEEEKTVTRMDDSELLSIRDYDAKSGSQSLEKTCGEWVKEGRGLIASSVF